MEIEIPTITLKMVWKCYFQFLNYKKHNEGGSVPWILLNTSPSGLDTALGFVLSQNIFINFQVGVNLL